MEEQNKNNSIFDMVEEIKEQAVEKLKEDEEFTEMVSDIKKDLKRGGWEELSVFGKIKALICTAGMFALLWCGVLYVWGNVKERLYPTEVVQFDTDYGTSNSGSSTSSKQYSSAMEEFEAELRAIDEDDTLMKEVYGDKYNPNWKTEGMNGGSSKSEEPASATVADQQQSRDVTYYDFGRSKVSVNEMLFDDNYEFANSNTLLAYGQTGDYVKFSGRLLEYDFVESYGVNINNDWYDPATMSDLMCYIFEDNANNGVLYAFVFGGDDSAIFDVPTSGDLAGMSSLYGQIIAIDHEQGVILIAGKAALSYNN